MKITIKRNDYDEYEVPTGSIRVGGQAVSPRPDSIYFTDDKDDAEGTARYHHGDDVVIRHARGTYQED
jgi:hypothetical protein